jgi:hypothetical protein
VGEKQSENTFLFKETDKKSLENITVISEQTEKT